MGVNHITHIIRSPEIAELKAKYNELKSRAESAEAEIVSIKNRTDKIEKDIKARR